jgi:HEAT repeat protein
MVPALVAALKDPDEKVRKTVIIGLGQIGPAAREAVPALLPFLKDDELFRTTAETLSKMGPAAREVVPDLIELWKAENRLISGGNPDVFARALYKIAPMEAEKAGVDSDLD